MSEKDPDFGISRLDQESVGTHGWQVRFQRKGVRQGRFFSDTEWGGKQGALETARKFRDQLLAQAGRQDAISSGRSVRIQTVVTRRNQSGVVGVSKISQRSAKGDEYHFWQASWTSPDGTRETIRFSVKKHGDEVAFELACEARHRAIR